MFHINDAWVIFKCVNSSLHVNTPNIRGTFVNIWNVKFRNYVCKISAQSSA